MQIRPIKTEQDHHAALKRIEALMSAAPGTAEEDELDVLITLVDAYETKRFPIDAPDPIAAIEFRMEQQNLSRSALEPMIGSRGRVSEILLKKRSLTLEMVRKVSAGLQIPADLLIAPYSTANRSRTAHIARTKSRKAR